MSRDDEQRGHVAPKKGLPWLLDKLAEGKDAGAWQDSTTTRHEFKGFNARLVTPDTRTTIQKLANEQYDARKAMNNTMLIDLMSIRIQARDRKRKGRVVETWLTARFIWRILDRVQPSRAGFGHDKYSAAMLLLVHEGIAMPHPSGRDGYTWTHGYQHIGQRATWLVDFARRAGEMRKMSGPQRFEVFE